MGKKQNLRIQLGKQLRILRKGCGMSQEKLAHSASCAVSTIGRIERGELNVTIDLIEDIVQALHVPPRLLFQFQDSTNVSEQLFHKLDSLIHAGPRDSVKTVSLVMDSLLQYRKQAKKK